MRLFLAIRKDEGIKVIYQDYHFPDTQYGLAPAKTISYFITKSYNIIPFIVSLSKTHVNSQLAPNEATRKALHTRIPELTVLIVSVLLGYLAIAFYSNIQGTEVFSASAIVVIMLGSFLISIVIAIIAVIGGVGGGVIFTSVMLGFTSVDSLIVRSTGLVVAMFSGLVSSGPLLRKGLADIKLVFFGAVPLVLGSIVGAYSAVYFADQFGDDGDAVVRLLLGLLTLGIAIVFIIGGDRSEYPTNKKIGKLANAIGLKGTYWDQPLKKEITYQVRRGRYGLILLVLVGFVGGFFGLGGGWAVVPIFNLLMFVPLKLSAGCSGVMLALGNAAAIWPYIAAGAVIPLFVAPWMLGQVIGGIIGAYALNSIRAGIVRKLLVVLLMLTSLKLLSRGIEGLLHINIPIL